MSGRRSGVATQIALEEPRAIYLHCMGHSLNLAVQDTCRCIKIMSDTFYTVLELSKMMKYSAKKKAMLVSLKEELSPHLRPLCPTRWTVRAESLRSIIANYEVVQQLMEDILEGITEATSVARAILATMERFSFLFGLSVSERFFAITDTLSKAVQRKTLCAVEARKYATLTLTSLNEERNDERFNSFWQDLLVRRSEFGVDEPILPRKRRAPSHFDEASKTYLRCTMKQDRLNHLLMLYIHKDRKIDIIKAMQEFVQANSERLHVFGKFLIMSMPYHYLHCCAAPPVYHPKSMTAELVYTSKPYLQFHISCEKKEENSIY